MTPGDRSRLPYYFTRRDLASGKTEVIMYDPGNGTREGRENFVSAHRSAEVAAQKSQKLNTAERASK